MTTHLTTSSRSSSLQWDIFCKVIDNFGDIGVCWRLAVDLAAGGQRVRLWADDASALAWMAPSGCAGVQVLPWTDSLEVSCLQSNPCEVLIEAFGCEVAPDFIAACACIYSASGQKDSSKPLWINLEHLSAEPYVERNHGLTNLTSGGPAAGWKKVFFYPGFTAKAGGLLREADLSLRQATFDKATWLRQHGIAWQAENSEVLVSLFCYEPAALSQLLNDLTQNGIIGGPVRLLVAAGRSTDAAKALELAKKNHQIDLQPLRYMHEQLSISYLPLLSQTDYDHLLWASDINFVRGEDSMVRAIWAGKPFVWQVYPQDDGVHAQKLEAFLDMLGAPPDLRTFHRAWNGLTSQTLPGLGDMDGWQQTASNTRYRLAQLTDLTTGLGRYAQEAKPDEPRAHT